MYVFERQWKWADLAVSFATNSIVCKGRTTERIRYLFVVLLPRGLIFHRSERSGDRWSLLKENLKPVLLCAWKDACWSAGCLLHIHSCHLSFSRNQRCSRVPPNDWISRSAHSVRERRTNSLSEITPHLARRGRNCIQVHSGTAGMSTAQGEPHPPAKVCDKRTTPHLTLCRRIRQGTCIWVN